MSFFSFLPRRKQPSPISLSVELVAVEKAPPPPAFAVEYYPESGFYFAKYGDEYLYKDHQTGWISLKDFGVGWYSRCTTEAEADKLIALYKEQEYKEKVVVIPKS